MSSGPYPCGFRSEEIEEVDIKLIRKDTDYAVKALLYISQNNNGRVSAGELSRKLCIPYPYLRSVLQTLNARGILNSFKGKGGGFALARSPEEIYLTDLIKVFQGPVSLAECVLRSKVCPGIRTCPLRKITLKLQAELIAELKPITLASMLKKRASWKKRGGSA